MADLTIIAKDESEAFDIAIDEYFEDIIKAISRAGSIKIEYGGCKPYSYANGQKTDCEFIDKGVIVVTEDDIEKDELINYLSTCLEEPKKVYNVVYFSLDDTTVEATFKTLNSAKNFLKDKLKSVKKYYKNAHLNEDGMVLGSDEDYRDWYYEIVENEVLN
jgi:hypothetical protein